MPSVPIIDVAPLRHPGDRQARDACTSLIDQACRDVGFFLVVGHGVPSEQQRRLDGAARAFFALPEAEKAQIAMARAGRAWRGWFPEGGELTSGRPDAKEGCYFGAELAPDDPRVLAGIPLHGPNLFPDRPAELRTEVLAWIDTMTELGHALVGGVASGLGLDPEWFDRHLTADPTVLFRIFRYPPRRDAPDGWGVAEHTDYGLLTILAHDGTPGLQVRPTGGEWLDVPVVEGAFVVNLGDMLERMTGGRYRSTPHRVVSPPVPDGETARDRLSFPFFFDPGWDAEVRPVPVVSDPGRRRAPDRDPPRWDGEDVHEWSGTYGDYLTAKVAKVFPQLDLAATARDAGRGQSGR